MLKALDRGLTHLENAIMFVALMSALAIGIIQVFCRYVLNTGIVWSELAVVTLTVLAAFVGGARAASRGVHVRITLVAQYLAPSRRRYMEVFAVFISIAYCMIMAYASWLYVVFLYKIGVVSSEANIPMWVIYIMAPLSMALFIIRFIQNIPDAWSGRDPDATEFVD
jgi:C4-dicarboxylate transporter DctQ subunit